MRLKHWKALLGHSKVLIYSTINEHSDIALQGRGKSAHLIYLVCLGQHTEVSLN